MYYFYNRALDAVLTTNGWVEKSDLSEREYLLLSVTNSPQITQNISRECGKVAVFQTICVREEKFKNNLPSVVVVPFEKKEDIRKNGSVIIHYLKTNEGKILKTVKSTLIFPIDTKSSVEVIEKSEKVEITKKVQVAQVVKKEKIQMPEIPVAEQKMTGELDREKRLQFKSNLKVTESEFGKKVMEATTLLQDVLSHSFEVSLYYAGLLSDVDQQIDDILHFVEFSPVNSETSYKTFEKLQDLRIKRRYIKDSMVISDLLLSSNLQSTLPSLEKVSDRVKKMDDRRYLVKQPEEFKELYQEFDENRNVEEQNKEKMLEISILEDNKEEEMTEDKSLEVESLEEGKSLEVESLEEEKSVEVESFEEGKSLEVESLDEGKILVAKSLFEENIIKVKSSEEDKILEVGVTLDKKKKLWVEKALVNEKKLQVERLLEVKGNCNIWMEENQNDFDEILFESYL